MEKFKQQPNLEDAQAQTPQTREQFEQERDIRAEERSRYRTIWQKILGREKIGEMDIAVEEALRMDAEIETMMQEGKVASTTEAVEVIEKEGKFGLKGQERIGKEEWARFRTLQFGGALEENDFGKASEIVYQAGQEKKVDDENRQILEETIAPLITQKVAELIQAKDGRNFVRAFYELGRLQPITAEGLSQENLQSPEIQGAIKENLISWMRTDPEYFAKYRDKWANNGFVENKEALNTLPEIQQIAKEELISWMNIDPEYFAKYRNKWEQSGIINGSEMNMLQEVQNIAKDKLIDWMRTDPEYFAKYRDKWAQAGIIDAEALSSLPEIQGIAKEKLISWMRTDPKYFAKYRDLWGNAGIIEVDEMNTLEEIQKIAREKLLSWNRIDSRYFAKYRDIWAGLGIINAEEANGWIKSLS